MNSLNLANKLLFLTTRSLPLAIGARRALLCQKTNIVF